MNQLQTVIFEIIVKIANTPGAFEHGDSVLYGLKNYIARHSLASDHYYVSEGAWAFFKELDLQVPLRRSRVNRLKEVLTFEHPVPSSVVMHAIKSSNRTASKIGLLLDVADCVTLISKDEDRLISKKYKSKMPDGWEFDTGNPFARYDFFNVVRRADRIPMIGSLVR